MIMKIKKTLRISQDAARILEMGSLDNRKTQSEIVDNLLRIHKMDLTKIMNI